MNSQYMSQEKNYEKRFSHNVLLKKSKETPGFHKSFLPY
jgi:hypothetical protein